MDQMRIPSSFVSLVLAFSVAAAWAQEPVAPTPERAGAPRGENWDGYNIVDSFETGYRFREASGDIGKYRSDVNYGNGIRLLSSYLTINSRDGQGHYFDEIVLSTQGLGNDPYQSATLRIHKNTLYDYSFSWRSNDYVNPALTISNGLHLQDTNYRWQDHDLVLLPQSHFHVLAGFTRTAEDGPALSTVNVNGVQGNDFPIFSDVRRQWYETRLGVDAELFGFKLSVLRGWEFFKDDSESASSGAPLGLNPTSTLQLQSFTRTEPIHGRAPAWRVGLFRNKDRWLEFNGRFTYTSGYQNFFQNENTSSLGRGGVSADQVFIGGNGQRPVTTADVNLTVFPADRLTVTTHAAYSRIRMEGQNTFQEVNDQTLNSVTLNFQYLGLRTFTGSTMLDYRLNDKLSLSGGYQATARQVQSIEQFAQEDFSNRTFVSQSNVLHSGIANIRYRPRKGLTLLAESETGRANRPFYPTSEKDYNSFGLRARYRTKTMSLGATARTYTNFNSIPNTFDHSDRNRTYSAEAAWTPLNWLSFDASYSKLHLHSVSSLAYFVNSSLITGDNSVYTSNLHVFNGGARFTLRKKADLYIAYTRSQDTGDGRNSPTDTTEGSSLAALQLAQTFPLTFESPLARFSMPVRKKLRWNAGYQFYHYREEFSARQNYHAHTGFTSLSWSF